MSNPSLNLAIHVLAHLTIPTVDTNLFKKQRIVNKEFDQLAPEAFCLLLPESYAQTSQATLQTGEYSSAQGREMRNLIEDSIIIGIPIIYGNHWLYHAALVTMDRLVKIMPKFSLQEAGPIVRVSEGMCLRRGQADPEVTDNGAAPEQVSDRHCGSLAFGPVQSL
jgi:hypothetical protein